MIEASKEVGMTLPVVVRLQGTNSEEGRKILLESGLKVDVATDSGKPRKNRGHEAQKEERLTVFVSWSRQQEVPE